MNYGLVFNGYGAAGVVGGLIPGLMAGAEDHYVPLGQLGAQLQTLTNARSVTARLFTRAEDAQNHCQIGNLGLSLRVILGWLDDHSG